VTRKVVLKKKSGDVELSSPTLEAPVKEPEVEEVKEGTDKIVETAKDKEMDVDMQVEIDKEVVK